MYQNAVVRHHSAVAANPISERSAFVAACEKMLAVASINFALCKRQFAFGGTSIQSVIAGSKCPFTRARTASEIAGGPFPVPKVGTVVANC